MVISPQTISHVDEALKQWATPRQCEVIDAINQTGSARKAAAQLGVARSYPARTLQSVKRRAAAAGYSPAHDMTHTVPDGFRVKGVSTYYNRDGVAAGQWVKSSADAERQAEILREFVTGLAEEVRGLSPAIPAPAYANDDLLSVYPMGDPHFGMYAWADEAGEDFDLEIAERITKGAIDRLVTSSPPSGTGLLLNLGDFFHADSSTNQTPGHGHALDVDTRYAKVMQVGLRAMVHAVQRLAEKHAKVIVWNMAGNHDPHASFALALAMDAFFANNDRVSVDLSPSLFKYLRFGKVLIGSHHGHGAKMAQLPGIMATDRAQDWGLTTQRVWYCGHIHHKDRDKEHPGVVVETFRTLAPRDAWHAGSGYRAGRDMHCIVHHRQFGEVERHRCDIAMLDRSDPFDPRLTPDVAA